MAAAEQADKIVLARLSILKPAICTLIIAGGISAFVRWRLFEIFPQSILANWEESLSFAGSCVLFGGGPHRFEGQACLRSRTGDLVHKHGTG